MSEKLRVGPAYILIGNPVTANGADMHFIGKTRGEVQVTPNISIALGRTDQTGVTPLAGSVYFSGLAPIATVPFVDEDKEKLARYLPNSSVQETGGLKAIGFGSGFKHIADSDIKTLCILPVKQPDQYPNDLADDEDAIWLPAVICNEFGNLTFDLPDAGDDALNPHETQFAGLYRDTDLGDNAIPEQFRVLFNGAPGAVGLSWNLPALSSFA